MQHVLGGDGLGADARLRERHILRHRRIQVVANHDHVQMLVEGVDRVGVENLAYTSDEMVGLNVFDLMHPDDQPGGTQTMAALLTKPGARQTNTRRFRRKDGTWCWLESTTTNLLHDPNVRAIVANYRDVTERRLNEEALKASEERFRSIQESALDAIITMNAEGVITSWNPQAETTFGWTSDEIVGRGLAETIVPPQHREAHTEGT